MATNYRYLALLGRLFLVTRRIEDIFPGTFRRASGKIFTNSPSFPKMGEAVHEYQFSDIQKYQQFARWYDRAHSRMPECAGRFCPGRSDHDRRMQYRLRYRLPPFLASAYERQLANIRNYRDDTKTGFTRAYFSVMTDYFQKWWEHDEFQEEWHAA